MCVYLYVCFYILNVCASVCTRHVHVNVYVHVHVNMCVYVHVNMYVYVHVNMCVYVHVCMSKCMCM